MALTVHTQYDSRKVRTWFETRIGFSIDEMETLDAPETFPAGSSLLSRNASHICTASDTTREMSSKYAHLFGGF